MVYRSAYYNYNSVKNVSNSEENREGLAMLSEVITKFIRNFTWRT